MSATSSPAQRNCPVCGESPEQGTLVAERSFDPSKLTGFSYASRKTPEFMCHRLVKCGGCRVIFAADAPDARHLHQAYDESSFDSAREAQDAADSYVRALAPHLPGLTDRRAVLEIGAGTGAFLDRMRVIGFGRIVGVEPSQAAIAAASPATRPHLRHGIFRGGDFEAESFSLIGCFMTLEHVPDPLELVKQCRRLLIPGGLLVLVTHDYTAAINRLLGRRSPIIDIEHLQLFHPHSLERLLSVSGFSGIHARRFANTYRLAYWMRLLPVMPWVRTHVTTPLARTRLGDIRLSVNVGNLMTIGKRGGESA